MGERGKDEKGYRGLKGIYNYREEKRGIYRDRDIESGVDTHQQIYHGVGVITNSYELIVNNCVYE